MGGEHGRRFDRWVVLDGGLAVWWIIWMSWLQSIFFVAAREGSEEMGQNICNARVAINIEACVKQATYLMRMKVEYFVVMMALCNLSHQDLKLYIWQ